MADTITLFGNPTRLDSSAGRAFTIDATRAAEGLFDDATLREKYELDDTAWKGIAESAALIKAIRAERERRVLNGVAAREAAAGIFARAPKVLDGIMNNGNDRSKIDAIRELRQTAIGAGDSENAAANTEKFIIQINLGADVERYELPVKPQLPAPGEAREVKVKADDIEW